MNLVAEEAAGRVEDGFREFVEDRYGSLWRAFYLLTGSREEADDLAQEAFCRAFERWERVRGMENPAGYLYRIGLNLHRSVLRRLATVARHAFRSGPPEDLIEGVDRRDAIRRALVALPVRQREALVLVDWLGLSSEEAGRVLGVAPGTVRVRVSRARQALRERGEDEIDG
ncbi:MAG: RNA polymerase sigma factor [Actinomycetota bacterium]